MPPPDIPFLHHEPEKKSFKTCQVVFKEGDPGDVMYAVISGEVDILIGGQVVEVVKPGGILGEIALIDNSPRSATAVARTECKVAVISQKRFTALIQQNPFFALQVMRVLTDRLRRWGPQTKAK